ARPRHRRRGAAAGRLSGSARGASRLRRREGPARRTARARAMRVALVLLLVLASPARAEVWPVAARAACAGPLATLEPGALALWSNPALVAGGARWRAGAASLEPFAVPALARTDAAVTACGRAWGASAGWSRFGQDEWSASAAGVGLAGTVGRGALA